MNILPEYIEWHYFKVWPNLFKVWRNLTLFPFYYFSIPLHLRTLLSPWKRQQTEKKPGLFFDNLLNVFFFNVSSRIIGFVMRITTIIYGLVIMCLFFTGGIFLPVAWIFMPAVSFPLFISSRKSGLLDAKDVLHRSRDNLALLTFLIIKHDEGIFVLLRLGLKSESLARQIISEKDRGDYGKFTSELQNIKTPLTIADLIKAIALTYTPFKNILDAADISAGDIYETAKWYENLKEKTGPPLLLDLAKIKSLPGIGVDWAYGYTPGFDKYARDMTRTPSPFPFLIGRESEILEMEKVLIKSQENNMLIVGEPGVARHMLVETLAHRMLTGMSLPNLSHKRILSIDMHALVASKPSILEVKGFAAEILSEAESAGNIIVFIDEIDKYVASGQGRIDLTDVFEKIARSNIGLIGITTPAEYHRFIETNPTLCKLLEIIEVKAPDSETVLTELELSIVPVLERKYKITITYQAVKRTLEDANRYLTATPYPGKAIDILDESAVAMVTDTREKVLTARHIDTMLTKRLHVPVGEADTGERQKLAHLEEYLHTKVINQEAAITALSASFRRSRMNVAVPTKPIGSFLFLGPTGVGKTETAKALAELYFGSSDKLLRFDMSQYHGQEGRDRLIGSVTFAITGELTTALRSDPFSTLLLDEFEKADKELYNLFLTVLDEGYITDAAGKKVDAKNAIVIATSNAGSEFIRESINRGINGEALQKAIVEYVLTKQIFSPELVNRFDAVVVFTPLSEGHLREIAKIMLTDLNKRLSAKDISVAITPQLISTLAAAGFDPQFGARAMRRAITEKVEDQVAQKLLEGKVKKGEVITISLSPLTKNW
jgi:ATP-dependent Clp protease ATP-binding subunit ClpC